MKIKVMRSKSIRKATSLNKTRKRCKKNKTKRGSVSVTAALKHKYSEKNIQEEIYKYIRLKYPSLIFTSLGDFSSARQAGRCVKMGYYPGVPDFVILHPMGEYCGLLPELKTEQIKHNGKIIVSKGKPSKKQKATIKTLNAVGYLSCTVYGLKAAISLIDVYMSLKKGDTIQISN